MGITCSRTGVSWDRAHPTPPSKSALHSPFRSSTAEHSLRISSWHRNTQWANSTEISFSNILFERENHWSWERKEEDDETREVNKSSSSNLAGTLDHSFSLLHQVEHSLNDTDLQKYNKESMKGCVFQTLELSEIHYVVFSNWISTNILYSIVHKIFTEDLDGTVDRPLFIKYLLRTWIV